jgi:hypothetical protein
MSTKLLYKTTNIFVLIVLFILKSLFFFQKKHDFPKIFFLSLTKDQINQNSDEDFLDFILEDRFSFNLTNELVVLELRHVFPKKVYKKRNNLVITRDLSLYLVLHHIKFKHFFTLYGELRSNLDLWNQERFDAKLYKQNIFDLSVWNLPVRDITTETFLVTTPSHMSNLPSIFKRDVKKIRKIMMWYSTNSVPLNKIGQRKTSKWLNTDIVDHISEHYVWNSTQALDLENQGVRNCKVVGSILFYPKKVSSMKENVVTYFDVTPLTKADTVYTEDSCVSALIDITESFIELNEKYDTQITLQVKPKRFYSKLHSSYYISTLLELHNSGKLEVLDWNKNLYECISSSKAILSVPYSSPIEIGIEMDVPGAYYFDRNTDWDLSSNHKIVPLFTSKSELKTWLEVNVFTA